ncbi:glycosyltransferase 87 family protein [Streptomyces sp. NPDC059828]|uniref:glycosyltransferase 87 family protein n=1 Tax=Streptomyces sp. NPDC059828 TaxID=3346965 RepID=UPI00365088F8
MRGAARTVLPVAVCLITRIVLLLWVLKVLYVAGPDVTSDVEVIYQGWYEVLKTGTFPLNDVTWQYPPAAALAILSPGVLPFLGYAKAFFVVSLICDALVFGLLMYAGRHPERPARSLRGVWVWVLGVPLLGPTAYARYDLMVTAVAVAALLAAARRPALAGVLTGFGAMLKVWPLLLLAGMRRGSVTRTSWTAAGATVGGLLLVFGAAMPGALAFLGFQRDRGTEVESLGALVFHVARHHGWEGQVLLNYGSVEFLGPYVPLVSRAALALTAMAFAWLLIWRLRAREFTASTAADAAFTAVLLFTTTSRVISPQYMIWLVGLAAVCLVFRSSRMTLPACLVLVATGVTYLEFPIWFADVVASSPRGIALLVVRNGLLVAATLLACRRLWISTVPGAARRGTGDASPDQPLRDRELLGS